MKTLKDAAKQAALDAAEFATSNLRGRALDSGWDMRASMGTEVTFNGSEFNVDIAPEHKASVFDLEYGTEDTPPTAVVRKFANSGAAEAAFVEMFYKNLGRKI